MKMKKLALLIAVSVAFSCMVPASYAAKLNIEQDFENFTPDKTFAAKQGGYTLGTDNTTYIMVSANAPKDSAPVINVNCGTDFTLEFDTKSTGGQQAIIEAKFEGESYYTLFQYLSDGRGPILRTNDNSPYFMYGTADEKPDVKQWHSFKIVFGYTDKSLSVSIDGNQIEKFYDRSYSEALPTFSGAKLESLRLYVDPTKSGDACYDNIRIYTGAASQKEFGDDLYKQAYLKAEKLGGVPDSIAEYPIEQNLTRGEFTELIMQTLGLNIETKGGSVFEDVSDDMSCAAAVNMAEKMGFIKKAARFRPDDSIKLCEAVTIICNINGYDGLADISGGWPSGYMNMAYDYKLLENIRVVNENQLMNMKDSFLLTENMLTVPMLVKKVSSRDDVKIEEDKEMTALYKYHGLKEIKCTIDRYDDKNKTLYFAEQNGGTYAADYDAESADIDDTMQYAWVTKDYDKVEYLYPIKDSAVVYGYISAVNRTDSQKAYEAKDIKRIEATNCVSTHLGDGAEITVNGNAVAGTITPVGMYARIVVTKGEITKIDFYDLSKGGMIESAGAERIVYVNGANGYSVLENIDDAEYLNVIADDVPGTMKNLKLNTYFDYAWVGEGLVVVASSNKAEGTLRAAAYDGVTMETEKGEVYFDINPSDFYIASGEEDYGAEYTAAEFLNSQVTVYADTNGYAHYMKAGEKNEFYGVVVRYDDECAESDKPTLTLAKVEDGAVREYIYEVDLKSKTIFYPEVSYYDAALNSRKTDGSGVYKFSLKNNVITKIEAVQWYKDAAVTLGDKFDYRAVRVNFDGKWKGINQNRILLLKNGRGEFEVQTVKWADLVNKWASGAKALVENSEPISKIMILTDYDGAVYKDETQFGFVENINPYYGDDDEVHMSYKISKRGVVQDVDAYEEDLLKFNARALQKYDYIAYAPGSLNKLSAGFVIKNAVSLSGEWKESSSSTLVFTHMGAYCGITNGYLKTTLDGENKYMLLDSAGYTIYSADSGHSKFKTATLGELVGKDLWVISIGDIARSIYFEK